MANSSFNIPPAIHFVCFAVPTPRLCAFALKIRVSAFFTISSQLEGFPGTFPRSRPFSPFPVSPRPRSRLVRKPFPVKLPPLPTLRAPFPKNFPPFPNHRAPLPLKVPSLPPELRPLPVKLPLFPFVRPRSRMVGPRPRMRAPVPVAIRRPGKISVNSARHH